MCDCIPQSLNKLYFWFASNHLGSEDTRGCGCRGWCSLYPLLNRWAEDLQQLANRTDLRYMVLDVQCDWPAWLEVVGSRYWSHGKHPCPLCCVNQEQLSEMSLDNITLDSMPFQAYQVPDYDADIARFTKVPWHVNSRKILLRMVKGAPHSFDQTIGAKQKFQLHVWSCKYVRSSVLILLSTDAA